MLLILIALGFGALVAGSVTGRASMTPGLALDLEGGTQIILTPTTSDGSTITDADVDQAIDVIRQRVDASGVAEAQISRQGGQNIVVSLPGKPSQETLDLVRTSAVMYFRPVLRVIEASAPMIAQAQASQAGQQTAPAPSASPDAVVPDGAATAEPGVSTVAPEETEVEPAATQPAPDPAAEPTEPAAPQEEQPTEQPTEAPAEQASPEAPTEPMTAEQIATQAADVNGDGTISTDPLPATSQDNSSDHWMTEKLIYDAYMTNCTDPANLTGQTQDPKKAVISCAKEGAPGAYILGPAEITGTELDNAASGLETTSQGGTTNRWVVSLEFDSAGTKKFSSLSGRLIGFRDSSGAAAMGGAASPDAAKAQFAIVLDGLTIMASGFNPEVTTAITDGRVQISGDFTQNQANTLANQLSFGSLPLSFTVQSEQQISATLGTEQLRNGLIAGLIGFGLIIIYLAWQYRGLSIVAVLSLIIAAAITYLAITALSWGMGYRLSLAGVAGLIIAIGITVDSFIIYFERIRDEVRQGRVLATAIDEGWKHARRTIIVSDIVNLVAAVVLYFLAVGGVQGFAFTLGVTTLVDLAVVVMFTHPFMVWLVRFRFFGEGHRLSGLDPEHLGSTSASTYGRRREAMAGEIVSSLARRKVEARRAASSADDGPDEDPLEADRDEAPTTTDSDGAEESDDAADALTSSGKDGERA
ncbi:protein translocase subunit SecD [Actinomyces slackii]|nr:protein translocase subunit SecD [Actinomyces slackii]